MLTRVEVSGSQRITYTQAWDYENRLTTVTNTATSPNVVSKFIYDGDPTPLRCGDFVDRA